MYLLSIEYLSRTGVTLFLNMKSLFGGNPTPSTDPVQLIDKSRPLLNNGRSVGGRNVIQNRVLGFRKYRSSGFTCCSSTTALVVLRHEDRESRGVMEHRESRGALLASYYVHSFQRKSLEGWKGSGVSSSHHCWCQR